MARFILALLVGLPFTVAAQNGSLGFVQFEAPELKNPDTMPEAQKTPLYIENVTRLGWAVLETNRLDLRNRLDFVVIAVDNDAAGSDSASVVEEYARFFRG